MADTDDRVELTDLDVIARYSLAVRAATADRHELIATLRADLDWLQGARTRRTSTSPAAAQPVERAEPADSEQPRPAPPRRRAATPAADRRAPAVKKATAKKAVARRAVPARSSAATKTAAKKSSAKTASARKTASRNTTSRSSASRSSATKKTAAKKTTRRR